MRLIDGDKLIEAIDKWQDTLSLETTAIDCVICDVLDSVVMIIDDMDTVEWIPVTERVPENDDDNNRWGGDVNGN